MTEQERLTLESRIVRSETKICTMYEELRDIKNSIRWLTGLVFSLNTTIIGILTKGFGLL